MTSIDGMLVDAAMAIEHTLDSEATDLPVESGGDITDHVRPTPIELSIEGVITKEGQLSNRAGSNTLGLAEHVVPTEAAARMREIRASGEPVTVITPQRVYESMALVGLSETETAKTGNSYVFTARFKQVTIVTNRRTLVPVSVPRARGKKNRGQKALQEASSNFILSGFAATAPPPKTYADFKEVASGKAPLNGGEDGPAPIKGALARLPAFSDETPEQAPDLGIIGGSRAR